MGCCPSGFLVSLGQGRGRPVQGRGGEAVVGQRRRKVGRVVGGRSPSGRAGDPAASRGSRDGPAPRLRHRACAFDRGIPSRFPAAAEGRRGVAAERHASTPSAGRTHDPGRPADFDRAGCGRHDGADRARLGDQRHPRFAAARGRREPARDSQAAGGPQGRRSSPAAR